jgi:hypothetical protein
MRRFLFLIAATTLFWTVPAGASTILMLNPGFELDPLACAPGPGCFDLAVIPDWSPVGQTATFKPSTGAGGEFPGGIPEGVQVAALGNGSGVGSIQQTLGANLAPNTTYTLTLSLGQRTDFPSTGYVASLLAGGSVIASDNTVSPAPGTFATDTIVFNSGPSPAHGGQPLSVSVTSVGTGQIDVDKVSLDASVSISAVPEPATVGLLAAALAAFALIPGVRSC